MQLLTAMNAETGFFSAMSMGFLVVSFTAPSTRFRLLELLLWLLCAITARWKQQEMETQLHSYLGAATADVVGRMSPQDRQLVMTVLQTLGNLANQEASAAGAAATDSAKPGATGTATGSA